MNKQFRKILVIMLAILLAFAVFGCKEEEEEVESAAAEGFADETVTQMNGISSNFVPDSMESTSSSSSSSVKKSFSFGINRPMYAEGDDDDPCDGTDSLFGCQPRLVKLYISTAKSFFDGTVLMMDSLSKTLGQLADGQSGTVTVDGTNTLHFSKTSSEVWNMLLESSDGTFLDVAATSGAYTMKMDMSNNPDEDSDEGQFEIQVNYTSETVWDVEATFIGQSCDAEDPRAPERVRVLINRNADIYTGKAMLYSPRWAYFPGDPSCSDAIDDDKTMNLYTDFIANDTAAKVKVYMMKRTVSDLSSIDDYAMNNMCNFYDVAFGQSSPANCSSLFALAGIDLTAFPNPFCTTGPDDATWGSDCTGTDTDIADAAFSSASDWTVPSVFYTDVISLRSSLD